MLEITGNTLTYAWRISSTDHRFMQNFVTAILLAQRGLSDPIDVALTIKKLSLSLTTMEGLWRLSFESMRAQIREQGHVVRVNNAL